MCAPPRRGDCGQRRATAAITAAWGRDSGDVTPRKGVTLGGGPHTLEVAVDRQRP